MREFLEALMKLKFSYAECTIVSSARTMCPLCQARIEPNVTHSCSRENKPARRRRARKAAK
jgi:hypothetical protein